MAGHGSCRKVLISGQTDSYYRLPQNVASLRQMYDVIVDPGKVRLHFIFNLDLSLV